MPHRLARAAYALLAVTLSASIGLAQADSHVHVKVVFDEKIQGVRLPNEPPEKLNDQLSEALSTSITESGRWFDFCWDLEKSNGIPPELVVWITKADGGSWLMEPTLTIIEGQNRRSESLEPRTVRTSAEMENSGPPARDKLPGEVSTWFIRHYLRGETERRLLHDRFKLVPVGRGEVGAVPVGEEKLCALYLPDHFKGFSYSNFKLIGKDRNQTFVLFAKGTGSVLSPQAGQELATIVLRPQPPMPPFNPPQGAKVTAYLLKYVPESGFGDIPQFAND